MKQCMPINIAWQLHHETSAVLRALYQIQFTPFYQMHKVHHSNELNVVNKRR